MTPTDFLMSVWGEQAKGTENPFFCVSTKSRNNKWKDHFLQWPISRSQLSRLIEKYEDQNLYFCPHGFTAEKRVKTNATETRFLWADLDEADPSRCTPVPQIAWESSPGRYAALWRLNKAYDRDKVEVVNQALSYSNGADRGGWDFSQVLRIPGTRNYKYKEGPPGKLKWFHTTQYPLSDFPDEVSKELDPHEVLSKFKSKIKPDTYRLLTAKRATQGKRSEVIWKLENELHEQGLSKDEVFTLIKHSVWNKFAGRRDEDTQLQRELSKVHDKKERPALSDESTPRKPVGLVRLADVASEKVSWVWWPYIPRGKLTLLEGDPGLGKSWLTMAMASHLSTRRRFPGQLEPLNGRVLIMSAEDGLGDTIRPRLDTMEADVRKIFAIPDPVSFDEEGMAEVEEYVKELRPILIVIDPLVAYLGGQVDLHKANETREVMARLSRVAEKYSTAILAVRHLTKGGRDKSIYRGIGSIDLTAAARSVMMVGRNPDDPDEGRVICHIKSNLGPMGKAMSYVLRGRSAQPFRWTGEVQFTAEEVFKAEATGSGGAWELAVVFLNEALEDGPRFADEVRRDAEAKGIATKLINQVKREIGVQVSEKDGRIVWRKTR